MAKAARTVVMLLALLALAVPVAGRGDEPVTRWGYITTSDGAHLRYTVVLPSAGGEFPVALIWSPYSDGSGPTDAYPPAESPVIANALLDAGYAVLGVNMRATGCSSGQWDLFQPADDGYEVVEWAAAQDWSDGDVGMFGFSAPGLSQLQTAATHPPHLRAITPADISTDFYRDVAYPGGIRNLTFTGFWTLGARPAHEEISLAYAAAQGDTRCGLEIASKPAPSDYYDFLQLMQHPYDDKLWDRYGPERILSEVDVPILGCQAWQDDQVSSHPAMWLDHVNPETSWIVFTNGNHGTCDDYTTPYTDLVVRFFDRYVRGVSNGFESEPHVQMWHETVHDGDAGTNVPSWIETHPSWPVAVEPVRLYLRADGLLSPAAPPAAEAPDPYLYPLRAASMESNEYTPSNAGWKVPSQPGGFVSYTTAPLGEDLEIFGPGSADLWLSSTAPDTDLQVTITEVRPDGAEVYVERGWLRASHRKLDASRSTPTRPYHTHLVQDAEPLTPLEPALLRVEVNPFGYVFRAGSQLRLTIEAPTGVTGLFGFDSLTTPAVNTILHDAVHPSSLVLGRVPGGIAGAPYPECDTVISHPCRPDPPS